MREISLHPEMAEMPSEPEAHKELFEEAVRWAPRRDQNRVEKLRGMQIGAYEPGRPLQNIVDDYFPKESSKPERREAVVFEPSGKDGFYLNIDVEKTHYQLYKIENIGNAEPSKATHLGEGKHNFYNAADTLSMLPNNLHLDKDEIILARSTGYALPRRPGDYVPEANELSPRERGAFGVMDYCQELVGALERTETLGETIERELGTEALKAAHDLPDNMPRSA